MLLNPKFSHSLKKTLMQKLHFFLQCFQNSLHNSIDFTCSLKHSLYKMALLKLLVWFCSINFSRFLKNIINKRHIPTKIYKIFNAAVFQKTWNVFYNRVSASVLRICFLFYELIMRFLVFIQIIYTHIII